MRKPEIDLKAFCVRTASALVVVWITWVSNSLVGIQSAVERIERSLKISGVASVGEVPRQEIRHFAGVLPGVVDLKTTASLSHLPAGCGDVKEILMRDHGSIAVRGSNLGNVRN